MSVYLFDMEGDPIAFRQTWTDPYLFDLQRPLDRLVPVGRP